MKKDWMQIAILCLCAALLVVTIKQGMQMEVHQNWAQERMYNLSEQMERKLDDIANAVERELEEANRTVLEHVLQPTGVDKENRALTAEVSVTLKEWYDDTAVTLLVTCGDVESALPMTPDGNGGFTAPVSFPLDEELTVRLDAQITGGGLTKRETLSHVAELIMLLPLQNSGGGWSGPSYRGGMVSSDFHISIEGQNGAPQGVTQPEFLVYKNGTLAQKIPGVIELDSVATDCVAYTTGVGGETWSIECAVGDTIEIYFRCVDEYGLGYEFLCHTWRVESEDNVEEIDSSASWYGSTGLELYWPE